MFDNCLTLALDDALTAARADFPTLTTHRRDYPRMSADCPHATLFLCLDVRHHAKWIGTVGIRVWPAPNHCHPELDLDPPYRLVTTDNPDCPWALCSAGEVLHLLLDTPAPSTQPVLLLPHLGNHIEATVAHQFSTISVDSPIASYDEFDDSHLHWCNIYSRSTWIGTLSRPPTDLWPLDGPHPRPDPKYQATPPYPDRPATFSSPRLAIQHLLALARFRAFAPPPFLEARPLPATTDHPF